MFPVLVFSRLPLSELNQNVKQTSEVPVFTSTCVQKSAPPIENVNIIQGQQPGVHVQRGLGVGLLSSQNQGAISDALKKFQPQGCFVRNQREQTPIHIQSRKHETPKKTFQNQVFRNHLESNNMDATLTPIISPTLQSGITQNTAANDSKQYPWENHFASSVMKDQIQRTTIRDFKSSPAMRRLSNLDLSVVKEKGGLGRQSRSENMLDGRTDSSCKNLLHSFNDVTSADVLIKSEIENDPIVEDGEDEEFFLPEGEEDDESETIPLEYGSDEDEESDIIDTDMWEGYMSIGSPDKLYNVASAYAQDMVPTDAIDVCGILQDLQPTEYLQSKYCSKKNVRFSIVDGRERINVIVWDEHVSSLYPLFETSMEAPIIVILTSVWASAIDDQVKLDTIPFSRVLINLDCEVVRSVKSRYTRENVITVPA